MNKLSPDLTTIRQAIAAVQAKGARRMIAIAGAPGSGKSTLAKDLCAHLAGAVVLPMDGFHLDNQTLETRGLLARKGAPQTFDVTGFIQILQAVSLGQDVVYPTFSRAQDRVVAQGGRIGPADHTILVEGNYLLLDQPGWRDLKPMWDVALLLEVPMEVLEQRLIRRWRDNGLDPDAARARAQGNDMPNAAAVQDHALPHDMLVRLL